MISERMDEKSANPSLCSAPVYQIQATSDSFEVTRQINQRFQFDVNNKAAHLTTKNLRSRLSGARKPF
jgi:hypothetical protein